MPRTSSTTTPRRLSRAEATRWVRDRIHFDHEPPDEERRLGHQEGMYAVRHHFNDRLEMLRILDALKRGRTEALLELQQAAHIRDTPAGRVRLDLFTAHMFGGAGGGTQGEYATGYFGAIATAEQYVRSVN